MQNVPAQWQKCYTFENNDSQTDLGIMMSKMNSRYLHIAERLKRPGVKKLSESLRTPLKMISQCDKQNLY